MTETTQERIASLRKLRDEWRELLRESVMEHFSVQARAAIAEIEAHLKELGEAED